MYRAPIATYRLQFNAQFTFQDAKRIVAYLHDLGITDLYASPLLWPRKGSMHGYDIVDANALNPELGIESDFDELHGELAARDMGLLLDVVPNHMAASHENAAKALDTGSALLGPAQDERALGAIQQKRSPGGRLSALSLILRRD